MFVFRSYLQKRVLNASKGPAVRALRAQTDKREYALLMKNVVERQVHIHNSPLPFVTFRFRYLFFAVLGLCM